MKTPTIADILHRAADHHLFASEEEENASFDDIYNYQTYDNKRIYSCDAVGSAMNVLGCAGELACQVFKGLREMGLATTSLHEFDDLGENLDNHFWYPTSAETQGARYAWL